MSREATRTRARAPQDPLSSKLALDFLFGALAATTLIYLLRLTPPAHDTELNAALEKAMVTLDATDAAAKIAEDPAVAYAMREHLVGFPVLEGDVVVALDYSGSILSAPGFGLLYQTIIQEVAFNSPGIQRVKLHAFNTMPNMFADPRAKEFQIGQKPNWVDLERTVSGPVEDIQQSLRARGWPDRWTGTERGALFRFMQSNLPRQGLQAGKYVADDNVGAALLAAVKAFDSPSGEKRHVLLIGDGLDLSRARPEDDTALNEAIKEAKQKHVAIHAIAALPKGAPYIPKEFYVRATAKTEGTLLMLPFSGLPGVTPAPEPTPTPPPVPKTKIYQFE